MTSRQIVVSGKPASSFGKKTIGHFLQEQNICGIFDFLELAKQDGFDDSTKLCNLIDNLIRDKRHEFTLGKGRKASKILMWKRRASQVPLCNVSLFQLVCTMKDASLVKKYLDQGVDVNLPIDTMYNGEFAGCSPLHLALSNVNNFANAEQTLLTIQYLLHYGADIHAKDSRGNTPLHTLFASKPFNNQLYDFVMKNGADNNATNKRGETPFELLLACNRNVDIENYMNLGGSINRFNSLNRKGCICDILHRVSGQTIGNTLSLMEIDDHGRTSIHNIVSFSNSKSIDLKNNKSYYDDIQIIIESFVTRGGNLNCQDEFGRTPLHYAATFQNDECVSLLLRLGADMNINDISSKSAMTLSLDNIDETTPRNDSVIRIFMLHLFKLKSIGLIVSKENQMNLLKASIIYERDTEGERDFNFELEQLKDTLIMGKNTLMLYDLISDTGIISSYPNMMISDRSAIDYYFKHFYRKDFSNLGGILILQYQKAQARLSLVNKAARSFCQLIGISMPDVCVNFILKYLKNQDLQNLIDAA